MENNQQLLSILTREGVLINVNISYWRGCKKLKPEDLGLEAAKVSDRLISLGHKRLLPRDTMQKLALIEGRAHGLIEGNTFPFMGGLAHFLPNVKLEEVTAKLERLREEFWSAKVEFLKSYGELRDKASHEWYEMARKLVHDPERVVANIEASFPLPDQMDRYYNFATHLFQIAVPERMGVGLLAIGEQQEIIQARQRAAQEAASKIQQGVESFVSDCVASLREQTAKLCEEMLASIRTCETGVHQKTLNRLTKFIDQFRSLNFVNDTEMEEQLDQVKRELLSRTAEEYRDSATARTHLVSGLTQLADHARQLAQQDAAELVQRFGQMGVRKFHLAA